MRVTSYHSPLRIYLVWLLRARAGMSEVNTIVIVSETHPAHRHNMKIDGGGVVGGRGCCS